MLTCFLESVHDGLGQFRDGVSDMTTHMLTKGEVFGYVDLRDPDPSKNSTSTLVRGNVPCALSVFGVCLKTHESVITIGYFCEIGDNTATCADINAPIRRRFDVAVL